MRATIASTAFLTLLGIDQVFAQWEGYGCCGVPTPGPKGAPAEWCENQPLRENGHRGYMLCCIEAEKSFPGGNGPGIPMTCQSPGFMNPQYIRTYPVSGDTCMSGDYEGFKACALSYEEYSK
ncbi:hypothetical protein Ptr902_02246 [Pyrenophora tritici-repentis]|uniref:Uncharacterized protein n=2 Tax=Pyrenophora tritici-repentis TaxID=45151 RepID=A0A5M9KYU1_9PLEO|nr:uncharacterized protein PTRG_10835 [Pyrenophora tritici-repentis Pt-1C-BFP]KAA8617997.1 hypothetical protein PtrV1_09504 [Pyrenophora tritici-repentis]EDU43885.1 predicted protein [Pyrenophora tritici-repentis Pt-1C-BFP]KAF7568489.1 hypothetical protein PtrM4_131020 [Pyrenophora tritici-repentis]KAI0569332.1 hypothetical protein Alg215_11702 [Pyrenophora tritici-repentis]KAI0582095.1 hypothetical protein Alg130_06302 [Pyrenophora tritici-repentis]